jgi:ferrous-iron efflux pump FieF
MRLVTLASVGVALSLVLAKAVAWWLTASVSMLGSLADSSLDLMASLITLMAVRLAMLPADDDHRFGHGKAEALAGLFQAALMTGSAAVLLYEGIRRILGPIPPVSTDAAIVVSGVAILLTGVLVLAQRFVVKRTGSHAIEADSLHYQGDFLINLWVIAGLMVSRSSDLLWVDGAFGAAIAIYIAFGAWRVGKRSVDMLMDREMDPAQLDHIAALVKGHSEVRGFHRLRTRRSGVHTFIQLHVELDPALSLVQAHDIGDDLTAKLEAAFPRSEVMLHLDPEGHHHYEPAYPQHYSGSTLP